jgi:MYXO-CTERM domain-containing protein
VTIMAGLQRLSALPMDTAVMSVQDAVNAKDPAVLVAATGWTDKRITLPVASPGGGELQLMGTAGSEPQAVTLDPGIRYGSLQTVFDGNRTLLIATSTGEPEQLDALLGWLNTDARRWARLSGDALLGVPGREPFTVGANTPAPQQDRPSQSSWPPTWWIAAALGAGLIAAAALFVLRRRHRVRQ